MSRDDHHHTTKGCIISIRVQSSHAAVPVIKINYSQLVLGSGAGQKYYYYLLNLPWRTSSLTVEFCDYNDLCAASQTKTVIEIETISILPGSSQFLATTATDDDEGGTTLCPNDKGKYFRKHGVAENKVRLVILCPPSSIRLDNTPASQHHHHPHHHRVVRWYNACLPVTSENIIMLVFKLVQSSNKHVPLPTQKNPPPALSS